MNKKVLFGGLFVLVLAVAAFLSTYKGTNNADSNGNGGDRPSSGQAEVDQLAELPQTGYRAPDFTLTGFDGKTVKLSDLRGKPVVLNFWASWCGPCRAEMPDLEEVYKEHQDHVQFYGVNLTAQDNEADARAFAEAMGVTFPMLLDKDGDVSTRYRVYSIPSTFAIDERGVVAEVRIGAISKLAINGMVERLVAE